MVCCQGRYNTHCNVILGALDPGKLAHNSDDILETKSNTDFIQTSFKGLNVRQLKQMFLRGNSLFVMYQGDKLGNPLFHKRDSPPLLVVLHS